VIFCGRQAIDGDTAQVGPETAEFLGIPQITYVKKIRVKDGVFEVLRFTETGDYRMRVKAPVLFTVTKELNKPRYPRVERIFRYYDREDAIRVLTNDDLSLDPTRIGLKGSPTNVRKTFVPIKEKETEIIEGEGAREKAKKLTEKLIELKLI
jgi:electron transfer flavoprotein beta subunit